MPRWKGFAPYRSLADSSCMPHCARIRDQLEQASHVIGGNDVIAASR